MGLDPTFVILISLKLPFYKIKMLYINIESDPKIIKRFN
jgi:hypothetical protein